MERLEGEMFRLPGGLRTGSHSALDLQLPSLPAAAGPIPAPHVRHAQRVELAQLAQPGPRFAAA